MMMEDLKCSMLLCLFVGIIFVCTTGTPMVGQQCANITACANLTNSDCNATTRKCQCNTEFFPSANMSACLAKILYNQTCTPNVGNQCKDANTECQNDKGFKCLCKATHYYKTDSCKDRIKVNETCTGSGDEHGCTHNAFCNSTSTKCQCNKGVRAAADKTCQSDSGARKYKSELPTLFFAVLVCSMTYYYYY